MKQQLENMMYDSLENREEETRVYQVGDLESLSATVLYTDHLPKMGFGGFKPLKKNSYGAGSTLDINGFENTLKPVSPTIQTYPPIGEKISLGDSGRYLERTSSSIKIFEEKDPQPLVRLDLKQHGLNSPLHLQFGKREEYSPDSVSQGEQSVDYFKHIVERLQIGKLDLKK